MSDTITLAFGEPYSDGSGWEWRVAFERKSDGSERVEIETGGGSAIYFYADQIDLRKVALALTIIADRFCGMVSEAEPPAQPPETADDDPGMNPK